MGNIFGINIGKAKKKMSKGFNNIAAAKPQPVKSREEILMDQARADREKDLAGGRARGEELFKTGSLDSQDLKDVTEQRRQQAQGFTTEEQNAMRDQNLGNLNAAFQGQQRSLRAQQGASGVRGALALAQQQKVMQGQQGQLAQQERDLFLENINQKRQGLSALEQTARTNQDIAMREKQGQITTELGYGSLGSAERGAVSQRLVGEAQAAAAKKAGGGGGKK